MSQGGDLLPVDRVEMIHEVKRELQMRRNVYSRAVNERRMNARQASRRITVMEAVLALLEGKQDAPMDRTKPQD